MTNISVIAISLSSAALGVPLALAGVAVRDLIQGKIVPLAVPFFIALLIAQQIVSIIALLQ